VANACPFPKVSDMNGWSLIRPDGTRSWPFYRFQGLINGTGALPPPLPPPSERAAAHDAPPAAAAISASARLILRGEQRPAALD